MIEMFIVFVSVMTRFFPSPWILSVEQVVITRYCIGKPRTHLARFPSSTQ